MMNKEEALELSQQDFLDRLRAFASGLTQEEADKRLAEYGQNVFGKKSTNAFEVLIRQFRSSIIYLLVIAAIISYLTRDYPDGTVILIILILNAFIGFYKEYRSEEFIDKLTQFISKRAMVKRDGQNKIIDESQIVPGDCLIIRKGDVVPADIRLVECQSLQVNESQLTGESMPVVKKAISEAEATDRTLLFAGTAVEMGEGAGVVYATGKDTELGEIAKLSTKTKKQTQYEKSAQSFSYLFVRIVLVGVIFLFVSKLLLTSHHPDIATLILFIIALIVTVMPESLPVITAVTLSSGALELAKKHVVVRRLSAMEDLGNVNVLCTDKTGTITENRMVIKKITAIDDILFQKLAFASIVPLKCGKHGHNSYDDAFINYVSKSIQKEAEHLNIVKELPFDPEDRRSRTVLEDKGNRKHFLVVIGAPETLLEIAQTPNRSTYLHDLAEEGRMGLHHLTLAYREVEYNVNFDVLENEHDLTFLGFVSLEDPLRSSARDTIQAAQKLGVKVKMLSGDSREVAGCIGRQTGLAAEGEHIYTGSELEGMSAAEFDNTVVSSNIFARVSPTQKFKIIGALKKDYVVAYQGDGINDASALKLADVAIAVDSATDIAKENADIVLLDKNLEVIINGIKYGRSIFANINKYLRYTMGNNFGVFAALAILFLFSASLPVLPVQALLNNLVGDAPVVGVYSDTVEDDEVIRPAKYTMKGSVFVSIILSIPTALFGLLYFMLIKSQPERVVQTSIFLFTTFQALIIFYAIRNKKHFWKAQSPSMLLNILFPLAFIGCLGITYMPQFQTWFSFVSLSAESVGIILGLVIVYFLAVDFTKVWYYNWTH
jgi:Mg2+-importing ATPase